MPSTENLTGIPCNTSFEDLFTIADTLYKGPSSKNLPPVVQLQVSLTSPWETAYILTAPGVLGTLPDLPNPSVLTYRPPGVEVIRSSRGGGIPIQVPPNFSGPIQAAHYKNFDSAPSVKQGSVTLTLLATSQLYLELTIEGDTPNFTQLQDGDAICGGDLVISAMVGTAEESFFAFSALSLPYRAPGP
jgi:hypothetical protein